MPQKPKKYRPITDGDTIYLPSSSKTFLIRYYENETRFLRGVASFSALSVTIFFVDPSTQMHI